MFPDILKILFVLLLAASKYLMGAVIGMSFKFSAIKLLLSLFIGGTLGSILFVELSDYIIHLWDKLQHKRRKSRELAGKQPRKKKKVFTKRNRLIIYLRKNYGLMGMVFISPPILTIPLGSFICVRFFKDKKKVTRFLIGAVAFWSIVVTILREFGYESLFRDMYFF